MVTLFSRVLVNDEFWFDGKMWTKISSVQAASETSTRMMEPTYSVLVADE